MIPRRSRQADSRPTRDSMGSLPLPRSCFSFGLGFLVCGSRRARCNAAASNGSAARRRQLAKFSPEQKHAIEDIVKDYLVTNPEVLARGPDARSRQRWRRRRPRRPRRWSRRTPRRSIAIPNAPVAGNPDGDITVVEFFDYNCGYCKRGFAEVAKLIETDKNVRFVFKEFPILRDEFGGGGAGSRSPRACRASTGRSIAS